MVLERVCILFSHTRMQIAIITRFPLFNSSIFPVILTIFTTHYIVHEYSRVISFSRDFNVKTSLKSQLNLQAYKTTSLTAQHPHLLYSSSHTASSNEANNITTTKLLKTNQTHTYTTIASYIYEPLIAQKTTAYIDDAAKTRCILLERYEHFISLSF